jgi:glycosyltransferase involved in cell wall biosynthesis/peptidoglycan/xylan/chitin deacetylase (PgdA/CDA1 family)
MLTNKAYYLLKPLMPRRVQLALRRLRARYLRSVHADVWPIDEKAGATPPNWPGWPDGKRFAFVLTHDVEGKRGLSRIEQLMNVELKHGFHSCFNLVPEGEYQVPDALPKMLDRAGFEVGVHGLEHDGRLYDSKRTFTAKVARIREYVQRWNASGFRSPLMQHRLAWLHQLGTEYDASTFDTDPFEPEPDGVGTIFPFWVPGQNGSGYVELPYSLVQDHTLFVVLRERNIDIWKRKLDWIVERGGMALLNTHPDYMCFDGENAPDEFPVSYYEEFLSYVRDRYQGAFWSAQPRDVARYYCASIPLSSRNSRKKVCMVAYTDYAADNRVRRYAGTLAKRGDKVDVIGLSGGNERPGVEEMNGVTVYKIQHRDPDEQHKWTYAWRLFRFLLASSVSLTRLHRRNRYDLIHVHNMPDFLVFGAWYPKFTGAKLILDVHDIVPELFVSKFDAKDDDYSVAILKRLERASAAFVDHVIVSNHLWYEKLISRSVRKENCSVFLNHVDPALFYRRPRTRNDGRIIIIFPGGFQWHQGLDIAIEALARIRSEVPNAELHLYNGAGGNEGDNLVRLAGRLGLSGIVKFCGAITLDQIPEVIANADLGVVPKRANSFGNEAYSTKIMEFMSQGVPVVVSRTKIDTLYFSETTVHFFTSGDSQALANAMLEVIKDQQLRKTLIAQGYEYVERNGWDQKKKEYLELVDSLSTETFCDPSPSISVAAQTEQPIISDLHDERPAVEASRVK